MAKSTGNKLKLLYLIKILSENTDENHGMSLGEIMTALEREGITAERKSLYDDFEALRLFGYDVEKRKGKTTTYHIISRDFQLPELKLLVDAVQSSKFITLKKSTDLIAKLERLCSKHEASVLQRQVYVTNRIKNMNESIYYTIDYLHQAIANNKKISFKYFEWTPSKEKSLRRDGESYRVSPWALCWDDENYYLIAFDSEQNMIRHYRVDKMLSLRELDDKRDGSEYFKNFDTALYSKKTFGMFGGVEETVRLVCKNHLAGVIIDRFGLDTMIVPSKDGTFTVTVNVAISPVFLGWVASFGADVVIDSPAHVKEKFTSHLKDTLKQYK